MGKKEERKFASTGGTPDTKRNDGCKKKGERVGGKREVTSRVVSTFDCQRIKRRCCRGSLLGKLGGPVLSFSTAVSGTEALA